MPTTAMVRSDRVTAVLLRYGAHRPLSGMLPAEEVRALAEYYRTDCGPYSGQLADELDALAAKADLRAAIRNLAEGNPR